METLDDIITYYHEKISLKWIEKKRKGFTNYAENYNKESDILTFVNKSISSPTDHSYYNGDEEPLGDSDDFHIDDVECKDVYSFTFPRYCAAYLPIDESTNWGSFPFMNNDYEINLETLSLELINEVSRNHFKNNDPNLIIKIINKVIEEVENKNNEAFRINKNGEYSSVVGEFLDILSRNFLQKYNVAIEIDNLSKNSSDYLLFELNQEDFAALLCLLEEAEIITAHKKKLPYLNFCEKHFKHKDSKNQIVGVNRRKLSDKISDIKNGRGGKGMENIKQKLWAVLGEFRYKT